MLALLIGAFIIVWLIGQFFSAVGALIAAAIMLLVVLVKCYDKYGREHQMSKLRKQGQKRVSHLHELRDQIDESLVGIEKAQDHDEASAHLERALDAMAEIESYSERLLEDAEMTKSIIPQQRKYFMDRYQAALDRIQNSKAE